MGDTAWLPDIRASYARYRRMAERAAAQVDDEGFFAPLGHPAQSLAVVMRHVGGNLRSRWRSFLTLDGEKADRHREQEFSVEGIDRDGVLAIWKAGWETAEAELHALTEADAARTITIRGEPLTVVQALLRNLGHTAYHVGQIVMLARHAAGEDWAFLSVPPGRSEAYNARKRAEFGAWNDGGNA